MSEEQMDLFHLPGDQQVPGVTITDTDYPIEESMHHQRHVTSATQAEQQQQLTPNDSGYLSSSLNSPPQSVALGSVYDVDIRVSAVIPEVLESDVDHHNDSMLEFSETEEESVHFEEASFGLFTTLLSSPSHTRPQQLLHSDNTVPTDYLNQATARMEHSDPSPRASPLPSRHSEPALSSCAGARPKSSRNRPIPGRQSAMLRDCGTSPFFPPFSPNTMASLYSGVHPYGTPPRLYGAPGGVSLMGQHLRIRHDAPPPEGVIDDNRRRHQSAVTAPDISQLTMTNNNNTSQCSPQSNGLTRRHRSNSAPAVMAIEREFGRQLREISDEFDREHQGPSRRTSTRARQRRGSLQANHLHPINQSFPGAEGQETGWWQNLIQKLPIPGLGSPMMSRHRTEPVGIAEHVLEEEESDDDDLHLDDLDGLDKGEPEIDEDLASEEVLRSTTSSPDSLIQFTAGPEDEEEEGQGFYDEQTTTEVKDTVHDDVSGVQKENNTN